jgi:predicted amidohydrolase YtcJ
MLKTRSLVAAFSAALSLFTAARAAEDPAEVVVLNGKVVTMDGASTVAEAVAIRNGRFVYVGGNAGARAHIGITTRVLDARGKTVLPGLIETHTHAIGVARGEAEQQFRQLSSMAEITEWVRQKAAITKPGVWIRIPRVDLTRFKEGRFPTRQELDAMVADRPVVFDWMYAGINQVQVMNTAALKAAGINRDTPNPEQGRIVRDDQGNPTGMIRNARALIERYLPPAPNLTQEMLLRELENVHRHYNSVGITSINDRRTDPSTFDIYNDLKKQGRLNVRATLTIGVGYQGIGNALNQIKNLPMKPGAGDDWVKVGSLKLRIDGGLLYGTAYLREPYLQAGSARYYDLPDAKNRGELMTPEKDILEIIRAGHLAGWQMSSHVAGDAGVDAVLTALETINRESPITERRYNLIHAYLPNAETVARAKKLGVFVDTQPMWYYKDGDALVDTIGQERSKHMIGLQDWLKAGVKVAINADHMQGVDPDRALNPYNPFLAMYVAITRKTESGRVYGPEQKVSRMEALRMVTIDAAYMTFDEKNRGSIEVGKLGDLAVLADDFMTCSEDQIKGMKVVATVVGGRIVHLQEQP